MSLRSVHSAEAWPSVSSPSAKHSVLVVGASSGLGAAMLHRFQSESWNAIGTCRASDRQSEPSGLMRLDVNDEASVSDLAMQFASGPPDVLVLNAGFGIAGAIEHTSVQEANAQIDTNLIGVHRMVRSFLPAMRERGSGTIIVVGSIGARLPVPFQALYCASKAAVAVYAEALEMEVRRHGIRVHLIEPGDHRTGFTQARREVQAPSSDPYGTDAAAALRTMAANEKAGRDPMKLAIRVVRLANGPQGPFRLTIASPLERLLLSIKRMLPQRAFATLTMKAFKVRTAGLSKDAAGQSR